MTGCVAAKPSPKKEPARGLPFWVLSRIHGRPDRFRVNLS